jgi:SAM-dependent methyltransferase
MGLRTSFWIPFFGVPRGPLGKVGARLMPSLVGPLYTMMAGQLDLQPDDDLLDVGCGSARLLQEHASQVHHVAGLDASEIQVDMARRRLADRIATGTAEVVFGNATALPWDDGAFSVVSSLNCLKFVPDPPRALREMHRVLRPGGRVVITLDDEEIKDPHRSGRIDAYGQWQWSADDARHMMEEAGFADVTVTRAPTRVPFHLLRGVKRPLPHAAETGATAEAPVLVGAAG